jgi:FkbM family methyltransferase
MQPGQHMINSFANKITRHLYSKIGISYNSCGVPFSLGKHLRPASNIFIIDVGAHQGNFTRSIDRLCHIERGILVELQPERAEQLRHEFPSPRFQVVEAALSDHPGTLELEINVFDQTTSILSIRRELSDFACIDVARRQKLQCTASTLDTVAGESGWKHIDLLKLDVQGAEHLVIKGGEAALARTKMIWTEVSFKQLYDGACMYNELFELLQSAGFALFELEPGFRNASGELVQADALFMRQ